MRKKKNKLLDNVIYVDSWEVNPKSHNHFTGQGRVNNNKQIELDRKANNDRIIESLRNRSDRRNA